ncbi:MAG: hypothetical protein HYR83_00790 [Planctomycetes bacterium]|nr:hypothetical protein [Planctomycetota bacterium]
MMFSAVGVATPPLHEQLPTMPWIMPLQDSARNIAENHTACASHVTRDGHTSIQMNVDSYGCNISGDAANEPSIVIDPTDSRKMAVGWRQFDSVFSDFRQAGSAYSHDGGHTWVFKGALTPGVFATDPVLDSDAEGRFYYLSYQDILRLFTSSDGGITWNSPGIIPRGLDKPWMAVDKTASVGSGNIYVAAQAEFYRSIDDGVMFEYWGTYAPFGSTIAIGTDGAVYVYNGFLIASTPVQFPDRPPALLFQSNGPPNPVNCPADFPSGSPNPGGFISQCWIIAREHVLYTLDSFGNSISFSRSHDGGVTWDPSIIVNDDGCDNSVWHWFPMMSVAPNGRIDVCWNDTRNYSDTPDPNFSELYYSYSIDGGNTWSPNMPVSPVFNTYLGWPQQNKIGDYDQMLSDNLGVNVAYAATFNGEQDIYFLRIGPWDCNGNQIDDAVDIASATSLDCNGNGVPDECEYRADFNGDGLTTYHDFATFLGNFTGPIVPETASAPRERDGSGTNCSVLSDIDHDGDVDLKDFYGLQQVFVTP